MFMKKKGIKYAVAKDGEEAVQKWKNGSFHLVLVSQPQTNSCAHVF